MTVSATLNALLPGLWTTVLAIASGAGGSALLEVYWKPRRERRKAATVLMADILLNTQLLLLQAHARFKNLMSIPGDFEMSLIGWQASASALSEMPAETIKTLVLLYNRYRYLNDRVGAFARVLQQRDALPEGDARRPPLQRELDLMIDTFNTGIDKAIEDGKAILPDLLVLSGVKEHPVAEEQLRNYAADVDKLFADREERIKRLNSQ